MTIDTKPQVLNMKQLRRNLGAKCLEDLPPDCVYIGRAQTRGGYRLPGSKWYNPFKIGRDGTRDEVIAKHRAWLLLQPELMAAVPELRGNHLVCWCAPEPCHGSVLLELANGEAIL